MGVNTLPILGSSEKFGNLPKITQLEKEGEGARLPTKQASDWFSMPCGSESLRVGIRNSNSPPEILDEGLDGPRICMDAQLSSEWATQDPD